MHKSFYQEYFELERNKWWFKARKNILETQIRKIFPYSGNIKILNIGIATGASTEWLSKFGAVTSVENDEETCEFVRQKLNIEVHHASITELPFDIESFDLVCAFDVVEHVDDDLLAVQEMKRVCKTGGVIMATVPAFMHLWSNHDVVNFHFRRYTLPSFSGLFNNAGLHNLIFKSYFNFFLYPPIFLMRIGSASKQQKEDLKSDFSKIDNSFLEKIFYQVFNFENFFLKKGLKFPIGVSIMVISRK